MSPKDKNPYFSFFALKLIGLVMRRNRMSKNNKHQPSDDQHIEGLGIADSYLSGVSMDDAIDAEIYRKEHPENEKNPG